MIRLGTRQTFVLTFLLLVMAAPGLYHFALDSHATSCRNPEKLVGENFLPSALNVKTLPWVRHHLIDGAVGQFELPGKWSRKLSYRISRTYNLNAYYFVPIDNFTNMMPEDELEVRTLDVDGTSLPIHLRLDESERESIVTAYMYFIGGKPVRSPFLGSLAQSFDQLRNGLQPLTMILITGHMPFAEMQGNREAMLDWMRDAWLQYDATCNAS